MNLVLRREKCNAIFSEIRRKFFGNDVTNFLKPKRYFFCNETTFFLKTKRNFF